MKVLRSFALALCGCIFLLSCSSTSPTSPSTNTKGVATALGTPVGSPSTATIATTGGSLMSPGGRLEITIPPNALSAATTISIQPVTNETPGGTGVGFSLTPNGLQFNQPVTLRFHYTSAD